MPEKNYGGLIIPKDYILDLLNDENGPLVDGLFFY